MASSSSSSMIPPRSGFIAEPKILAKYESAQALDGNAGVAYKGWRFTCHHAVIADEMRIKAIDTIVSTAANTQALLKTPEMIFGLILFISSFHIFQLLMIVYPVTDIQRSECLAD